jgi:hypothetical protein
MSSRLRSLHRGLAALVAVAVAAQFLLAGAGAFHATSFRPHTTVGWAIGLASLLILVIALAGRSERRASAALFAVVAAQIGLAVLGTHSSAWFGAIHGLNAVAVMAAAGYLARRTAIAPKPSALADRP